MDGPCCKHDPLRPMLASAQTIKSAGTRHRPLEQRQRFISTMRALCAHTRKCCNRLRAVRGGNSVVSFFQRYLARNALQAPRPAPAPRARAGSDRQRRRLAVSEGREGVRGARATRLSWQNGGQRVGQPTLWTPLLRPLLAQRVPSEAGRSGPLLARTPPPLAQPPGVQYRRHLSKP